jgi:hypothetical protein
VNLSTESPSFLSTLIARCVMNFRNFWGILSCCVFLSCFTLTLSMVKLCPEHFSWSVLGSVEENPLSLIAVNLRICKAEGWVLNM